MAERTFVLTSCRLTSPQSEHGLSYFLKEYFVTDSKGKRCLPEFSDDFHKRLIESNGKDRVKVEWKELPRRYRTLDKLIKYKEEIELELYQSIKILFSLKVLFSFYSP